MIVHTVTRTSVVHSRKVTIVCFLCTYRNSLFSRESSCVVFERQSVQPQKWLSWHFTVLQPIPRKYKYYHFRKGRGLQVAWPLYISPFFMIYALESYCTMHGWIQEIHLMKSLLSFSRPYFTLTEVFPWFFLSCKANTRVYDAKSAHGPHSPQPGAAASRKRLTNVAFLQFGTEPVWALNPESQPKKVHPSHI